MFGSASRLMVILRKARGCAELVHPRDGISHYDRRLGMSDAEIKPFRGLVDCGPPPDPARLREIRQICAGDNREAQNGQCMSIPTLNQATSNGIGVIGML